MKYIAFVGIDVSKEKLDFVVLVEGKKVLHQEVKNTPRQIRKFIITLLMRLKVSRDECLFCLEYTGIYGEPFLGVAEKDGLFVWLENAREIIAFHGLSRDKNDAVDALRIAEYAWAKQYQVKLWEPPRAEIKELKRLLKFRKRLVDKRSQLQNAAKEEKGFCDVEWVNFHQQSIKSITSKMSDLIKDLEKRIRKLLREDELLKKLFELISSVKGVGLIVAAHTIVVTNEFRLIKDPKKMACHCGVAPFQKQSGKSIKGRSKVSHRANKVMKTLLNLSARSAVGAKGELQDYYFRKVAEGKNKMSVMNAVRNKIIHRMFACVRDNRKYENIYVHNLA